MEGDVEDGGVTRATNDVLSSPSDFSDLHQHPQQVLVQGQSGTRSGKDSGVQKDLYECFALPTLSPHLGLRGHTCWRCCGPYDGGSHLMTTTKTS